MKMQRIERSSSSYEDFHSFNRASPLIKYPRSNLLSSNARRGETFLRFNYKTHPVFHREIIIFVSIRGEKRAIGDINSGEENAVAEPRFGFRIGTKDRLFEFRKEWGKARIILRRIPPRCYFKRRWKEVITLFVELVKFRVKRPARPFNAEFAPFDGPPRWK